MRLELRFGRSSLTYKTAICCSSMFSNDPSRCLRKVEIEDCVSARGFKNQCGREDRTVGLGRARLHSSKVSISALNRATYQKSLGPAMILQPNDKYVDIAEEIHLSKRSHLQLQ